MERILWCSFTGYNLFRSNMLPLRQRASTVQSLCKATLGQCSQSFSNTKVKSNILNWPQMYYISTMPALQRTSAAEACAAMENRGTRDSSGCSLQLLCKRSYTPCLVHEYFPIPTPVLGHLSLEKRTLLTVMLILLHPESSL